MPFSINHLKDNHTQDINHLPNPDDNALAHSRQLCRRIQDEIESNENHISFKRYMELALYEPGLGYYSAGARKFGEAGDFVTAPEISPLFSNCLARQCSEVLMMLEGGVILEVGAGTGVMACDVLSACQQLGLLPDKYLILETSADLKQRQQELIKQRIPDLEDKVEWLDQLPMQSFKGLILANEVIDAMPVHRFQMNNGFIYDLHVTWQDGAFSYFPIPADEVLIKNVEEIRDSVEWELPDGYVNEVNTDIPPWLRSLSDNLTQGVMLFIDYGYPRHEYYHPQRADGTLLCHYRHHVHADPFLHPGLQDITTSVDFTSLAEIAVTEKLDVIGYTSQAYFLIATGLEDLIAQHVDGDHKAFLEITRQAKILTLPTDMGERIKVMALGKNMPGKLMGFSMADYRGRL